MQSIGESFAEQNRTLVGRVLPCNRPHLPIFLDDAQGQIQQLAEGFIARELTSVLDDLTQLHEHALDGIGHVNDLAYFWLIGEEWNRLLPLPLPLGWHYEFPAPVAFSKECQCHCTRIAVGGLIDRFECSG